MSTAALDLPDGVVYDDDSGMHHIRVLKAGSMLLLYLVDRASGELEGPQSRIDLRQPLQLQARYTQLALLTLLWVPQPQAICMLGLAGGRLARVLHHMLPDALLDCVEIDASMLPIASVLFGVPFDERLRATVADGRAFLERGAARRYDIIIMDAFSDHSDELDHLATAEFYAACDARLAQGGAMCANMLDGDPRYAAKVATFRAAWPHVWLAEHGGGAVLFGSRARLTRHELSERALQLGGRHGAHFPQELAGDLLTPASWPAALRRGGPILRDRS